VLEKPFNRFVAGRVANWLMNFLRASGSSGEFACTTSYFALPSGVRSLTTFIQAGCNARPPEQTYHAKAAHRYRPLKDVRADRRAARADGAEAERVPTSGGCKVSAELNKPLNDPGSFCLWTRYLMIADLNSGCITRTTRSSTA